MTFAVCTDNDGYEAALDHRKVYVVASPEANDPEGYVRIIDESGEHYLYAAKGFEIIEVPNMEAGT